MDRRTWAIHLADLFVLIDQAFVVVTVFAEPCWPIELKNSPRSKVIVTSSEGECQEVETKPRAVPETF